MVNYGKQTKLMSHTLDPSLAKVALLIGGTWAGMAQRLN